MNLSEWAIKWGVSGEALDDLRRELGTINTDPKPTGDAVESEGANVAAIRLEASRKGKRLWRNNCGAFMDHDHNRMVRYGLANDTKMMNQKIKSSDLIGLQPVLITPQHVGQVIGQFVAREVKPTTWRYKGTERERAQLKFLMLILSMGGDASFAIGEGTL